MSIRNSHEANRAALLREREARKIAYLAAVEDRNELAHFANSPDALEYDRRALARADARVGLALDAMRHWGDPLPKASVPSAFNTGANQTRVGTSDFTAPEGSCSLSRPAGAVDPVEATAARIFASDTMPGEGRKDAEVDAIAARIAAA